MFHLGPRINQQEHSITLLKQISDAVRLLTDIVPRSLEKIEKALERALSKPSKPCDEDLKDIIQDMRAQNAIQIELLKRLVREESSK